ncbi:hypothetical protein PAXRUDRAFT_28137 [Paxillus rubicundulus Ve08.2h10]|uniref:Uncharacterized protein n=1 Tax=Paxillus rubicundulus Ve08.2h10 TaxID=930991 RepID=A0A0D0D9R1_9AGAM|nr:hypothetical protein PAXRUDRAFT_28137 [Paxillus rubicundulus Ve08.2h10]
MGKNKWATKEQKIWLTAYYEMYYCPCMVNREYTEFKPVFFEAWFQKWPEIDLKECGFQTGTTTSTLDPQQHKNLAEGIEKCRNQLLMWMRWRANTSRDKRAAVSVDPFKAISQLSKDSGKKRHNLSDEQVYSKLYYNTDLKPKFEAECAWLGLPSDAKAEWMAIRRKLTKDSWEASSKDEVCKKRVCEEKAKLDAQNTRLKAAVEAGTHTSSSRELKQRAINGLPAMLNKILEGLQKETGWSFTVLAGGPDLSSGGKIKTFSLHIGETALGMNFMQSHNTFSERVMKPFDTFIPYLHYGTKSPVKDKLGDVDQGTDTELPSALRDSVMALTGSSSGVLSHSSTPFVSDESIYSSGTSSNDSDVSMHSHSVSPPPEQSLSRHNSICRSPPPHGPSQHTSTSFYRNFAPLLSQERTFMDKLTSDTDYGIIDDDMGFLQQPSTSNFYQSSDSHLNYSGSAPLAPWSSNSNMCGYHNPTSNQFLSNLGGTLPLDQSSSSLSLFGLSTQVKSTTEPPKSHFASLCSTSGTSFSGLDNGLQHTTSSTPSFGSVNAFVPPPSEAQYFSPTLNASLSSSATAPPTSMATNTNASLPSSFPVAPPTASPHLANADPNASLTSMVMTPLPPTIDSSAVSNTAQSLTDISVDPPTYSIRSTVIIAGSINARPLTLAPGVIPPMPPPTEILGSLLSATSSTSAAGSPCTLTNHTTHEDVLHMPELNVTIKDANLATSSVALLAALGMGGNISTTPLTNPAMHTGGHEGTTATTNPNTKAPASVPRAPPKSNGGSKGHVQSQAKPNAVISTPPILPVGEAQEYSSLSKPAPHRSRCSTVPSTHNAAANEIGMNVTGRNK